MITERNLEVVTGKEILFWTQRVSGIFNLVSKMNFEVDTKMNFEVVN